MAIYVAICSLFLQSKLLSCLNTHTTGTETEKITTAKANTKEKKKEILNGDICLTPHISAMQ